MVGGAHGIITEVVLITCPNHDVSFTSIALITSACVGGHDANPINTISSNLEFALSSLAAPSDEQYMSIPNNEIALLARKFCALHKFHKERRISHKGCFECGDTTHFIVDCPKRKKFDSFNKYDYTNQNDSSNKGNNKKKNRFGVHNNKKKFQKIMSRACATLSDFDFSSEGSSSSEEDEKIKCKKGDFTGLCLMGKSSRNDPNSDFDISDDLSFKSLSLKAVNLENALCNKDKLLCQVFRENKNLNLKMENSFAEIVSLLLVHNDMSSQPCENCNMIMVNYADLWIVHTHVANQLRGAKLELEELKARSLLLGAVLECPKLKLELDDHSLKAKELERKLLQQPRVLVTSPPCEVCGSHKGKILHATKENSELKQEVAYLFARLERTKLSEKMIEDDLNHVKESATKSTYKLGVGFERCEDKGWKSAPKFIPSSNYHKEEETIKSTKLTTHPIQSHLSNPRGR
jgi:predicted Zn-ribbon and HTH transcriptional regulator